MDHIDEIDTIDWDNIEIIPLEESQIGAPESLMDEETMFAFVGLTLEKPSDAVEKMSSDPIVDEIMDITDDDHIPNEETVFHDMEDPPMDVGTVYANMNDFRRAVKQHAIKTQFELGTEKSNPNLFRGFCKAKSCPWSIVARLMKEENHVKIAREKLYGTWEDSFGNLFNFKAMVELKMPGSVVEIGLKETEDGVYFQRFFCCFKPSINGFLNGCRPYSSVDATALNDACKGLENAVKAVFPLAEHKECFFHLMKNFSKRFQGPIFGLMYPTARTFCPVYHEHLMHKMYEANDRVQPFLETYHRLLWMMSKFSEEIKCDYITNNIAEVWNMWVKDLEDLPIAELVDSLRSKFMELYARMRNIGERLEGHTMLPIDVRHLNVLSSKLGQLKVKVGGMREAEVTEITDRHK
ncbi:hypothetical protein SASPL_102187 [Salvia splendens]|uniref:Transposase MuDR plant domain-containing protein n=1 Tax=Salvia splendens TaxID=180675 RepID=A0A8X8YT72_SALSN|nr:hypothetical protein SASPL_102187 [Salvia splendens]